MTKLCAFSKFNKIFGISGKGVHHFRILDVAAVDYFLTLIGAFLLSYFKQSFFKRHKKYIFSVHYNILDLPIQVYSSVSEIYSHYNFDLPFAFFISSYFSCDFFISFSFFMGA